MLLKYIFCEDEQSSDILPLAAIEFGILLYCYVLLVKKLPNLTLFFFDTVNLVASWKYFQ